jgi:hypothetical protein
MLWRARPGLNYHTPDPPPKRNTGPAIYLFRFITFAFGFYLLVGALELLGSPYRRDGILPLIAGIALMLVPTWFTITSWLRGRRECARGFEVLQQDESLDERQWLSNRETERHDA